MTDLLLQIKTLCESSFGLTLIEVACCVYIVKNLSKLILTVLKNIRKGD